MCSPAVHHVFTVSSLCVHNILSGHHMFTVHQVFTLKSPIACTCIHTGFTVYSPCICTFIMCSPCVQGAFIMLFEHSPRVYCEYSICSLSAHMFHVFIMQSPWLCSHSVRVFSPCIHIPFSPCVQCLGCFHCALHTIVTMCSHCVRVFSLCIHIPLSPHVHIALGCFHCVFTYHCRHVFT